MNQSISRDSVGQSADLRTRIAKVLMRDAFGLTTPNAALRQADAIIDELSLTDDGGIIVGCNHD